MLGLRLKGILVNQLSLYLAVTNGCSEVVPSENSVKIIRSAGYKQEPKKSGYVTERYTLLIEYNFITICRVNKNVHKDARHETS